MLTREFNNWYDRATKVSIVKDTNFNCAGWFWLSLTPTQHSKMVKLIERQGAELQYDERGSYYQLEKGIKIYKERK